MLYRAKKDLDNAIRVEEMQRWKRTNAALVFSDKFMSVDAIVDFLFLL